MATINGDGTNNTLTGTGTADSINGLGGHDTIDGGGGNDSINGGSGDDVLTGGTGNDTLIGGAGSDSAVYAHMLQSQTPVGTWSPTSATLTIVTAGEGTDTLTTIETIVFNGVSFTVNNVTKNVVARLANDTASVSESDASVDGNVLSNDLDVDSVLSVGGLTGGTLGVAMAGTYGSLTLNANGTYSYVPTGVITGDTPVTDTFTYSVTEGGVTHTATLTVTIQPQNDAPVAQNVELTTAEDPASPIAIDVMTGATDEEGNTLSVSLLNGEAFSDSLYLDGQGTVSLAGGGNLQFVPDANFHGDVVFTYALSDGNSNSADQTVTLHITPVNDAPVANDGSDSVDEDAVLTGSVSASDVDGDTLTYALGDDVTNGVLVFNTDGSFSYTPGENFNGSDSFTYSVSDGNGGADTGTFTITVDAVNDAPVATDDSTTLAEDAATYSGAVSATDLDGDTLTYSLGDDVANGTLVFNTDGTFDYTPNADFNGEDSFTWSVSDGNGGTDTGTFTITVTPVADAPVAADGSDNVDEDAVLTGSVSATDGDNDTLTYSLGDDVAHGVLVFNTDGSFSYTPGEDFNGSDSFTYSVSDGNGGTDTGTFTITVDAVNDGPSGTDDTTTLAEDAATYSGAVSATDVDGDTLTYSLGDDVAHGTLVFNSDGTFDYTPDADFNGEDSFTWSVSDGNGGTNGGTFTITVTPVADAPVAADGSDSVDEDTVLTGSVSATDADGDTLTYALDVDGGTVNGVLVLNTDGSFTYTPGENFNGSDEFSYVVSDGNGGTDTGTFTITVDAVNDAPVAADDSTTLAEDAATYSGAVSATDVDGDSLTYSLAPMGDVANGTLVFNADGTFDYTPDADFNGEDSFTWIVDDGNGGTDTGTFTITVTSVNDAPVAGGGADSVDEDTVLTGSIPATDADNDTLTYGLDFNGSTVNGVLALNTDGTFTYTPGENFNGSDEFHYVVIDGNGGMDTGTFTITVDAVNDAPVAADDSTTLAEDAATYNGTVSATDVDGDSLTYSLGDDVAHGTLVFNSDGTFDYTPDANFHGEDSFTWSVDDGNGGTDTGVFTITVTSVNDDPVAGGGADSVDEDTVLTGSIPATDVDNDTLTYALDVDGGTVNGVVVLNTDGSFTYTPGENFNGSDEFSYVVSDGNGGTDTGTFTITVDAVNDAPVAADDSTTLAEDAATYSGAVSATDVDGDSLTYSLGDDVAHGTLVFNADGSFDYTPDADFNGEDSFTWSVDDGNGGTDTGTFTITVTPVNDAPVAADGSDSVDEDTVLTGSVSATDVDLDTLTYTVDTNVTNGVLVLNTDGSFSYTPGENFNGADSFTYTVSDGNGGTDTGTFSITVDAVNDAPVAADDSTTLAEDAATYSGTVSATDVEGDSLTYSLAPMGDVANGTLVFNTDGTFDYTPDANFHGEDSFTWSVDDGNGGTDTGVFTITVTSVNDDPGAADGSDSVDEDTVLTGSVSATDVDLDTLTYTVDTDVAHGVLVLNTDGSFSYTPGANFNGADSFTYTVSDGNGGTDTGIFSITVDAVADAAEATDFTLTILEDAATIVLEIPQTDPDGDAQTVTHVDGAPISALGTVAVTGGSVFLNGDGDLEFTPDANFHGQVSFQYALSSADTSTANGQVEITVTSVNDDPVAVDGSDSIDEDSVTPLTGVVAASDVDVDTLTYSLASGGDVANGTLVFNPDGSFEYTPDADFSGTDSFTFEASDGNGGVDTGVFTITVNPFNDAPVAVDGSDSVDEDAANPLTGSLVANDADADTLTYALDGGGDVLHGTLTLNPDGTFEYTPDANFHGSDSFTWTVSDGNGGTDTGTFEITVNSVNDQPLAAADINLTADEDPANPIAIDVLTGASDADLDTLSVATVNGEPMTVDGVAVGGGLVTVGMDGNLLFTAAPDFHGTVSFTYTLTDGSGAGNAESDPATVEIVIAPVNDAPVGQPFDLTIAEDDGVLTIDVLGAATDVEGDTISVLEVNGTLMDMDGVAVTGGVVTLDGDGNLVFTPDENFNGPVSFTYTLTDGVDSSTPATVDIDVTPVNDAPTAANFELEIDEDPAGALTIDVVGGGLDVDGDTLSLATVNGEVVDIDGVDIGNGIITRDLNGNLLFTPTANFNGAVSFTYALTDGEAVSEEGAVDILINPINDRPISTDLTATAAEDGSVTIDPFETAQDVEFDSGEPSGQPLAVGLVNGEVVDMDGVDVGDGVVTLDLDGKLVFTPDANFSGEVSFTYTLTDGDLESVASTVTVTVTPVNDAPTAADFSVSIDEDTAATFDVLGDGTDVEGDTLSVATVNGEVVDMDGLVIGGGVITINGAGNIVFTPDANFNGAASFTYTLSDGATQSAEANVDIAINAVNDDPVAADDSTTLAEDAATYSGSVSATDVDLDTLTYSLGDNVGHGTLVFNADGTFDYTPDADFTGEDSFTYTVSDGNGGSDTGTFTIVVTPVNDAPVAADGSDSVDEDTVLTGSVSATDVDLDTLTYTVDSDVTEGVLVLNTDGSFSYTPGENFNGSDSFTYTVSDGNGGTDTGTFSITVNAVNDAPVAADDSTTLVEDAATYSGAVSAFDVEGDDVVYSLAPGGDPAHGTLLFNGDGTFDYTPDADFSGEDSFTWSVDDGNGGTDTGTFTITVTPVNDAPTAPDISTSGAEDGGAILVDVFDGAADADSADELSVNTVNGTLLTPDGVEVEGGLVTRRMDGRLEFTPNANFNGAVSFTYTLVDDSGAGNAESAEASVDILVTAVNDAPILAGEGPHATSEDTVLTGQAATPTDIDNEPGDFSYVLLQDVDGLTFDTVTGAWSFDPTNVAAYQALYLGQSTTVSFTYAATDGDLESDPVTVQIAIAGATDAVNGTSASEVIAASNFVDLIYGGDGDDFVSGLNGNDTLFGEEGDDILSGGANDDTLNGGSGGDTLIGGSGNDTLAGGEGDDDMVGGTGTDVVTYASAAQAITANLYTGVATGEGEDSIGLVENLIGSGYDDVLTGSTGANSLWGGAGGDIIDGGDGLDRLYGEDGSDTLYGGVGSDILDGGAGDDFIYGGIGNDTLTGGSGADRFVFLAESFTTPLQTDTILDFNVSDGDVLDMSAIDANASIAGDQAFSRVGSFTGVAGQATVVFANNQTIIRFDLNGDRATDFQIRLDGDHTGTALLTGAEAPGTGGWIF